MSDALAKFKGAWASLPAETKGEIMQELGVPDGFNPFPIRRDAPVDITPHDDEDIIDAEFNEIRPRRRKEDLDDAFGV
tara:strand:- start:548 stop:781 length:234 start_codon:yes stop_codon:yes gene_type:complete